MRIVFISWWWPYPADNGSKIRIYNLLRYLSQQHEVTLLSFAEANEAQPEQIEHLRGFCAQVQVVPKPTYNPGALKATLGYLSSWPRSLVDVYSPVMAGLVAEQTQADVIVASQLQTMRYLEVLPDVPAVMEEAEVTIFHDRVVHARGQAERLRNQLTLTKLENAFKRLLERGAAFTVVSEAERRYIRHFAPNNTRIEVIPNGVDTQENKPDASIQAKPYSIIYTGAVTYDANLDAVTYFAHDVMPLIRQKSAQAHFTVTGGTGKVDVSGIAAQPGVSFSGYLPSVAKAVQESWVSVAPLRMGGGTRLKILEAMALGTPVVSTRKGAEGLNVQSGRNILIADTPQEIADALGRVFEDQILRGQLIAGGRALVEREYDWGVIGGRLMRLIEAVRKKG